MFITKIQKFEFFYCKISFEMVDFFFHFRKIIECEFGHNHTHRHETLLENEEIHAGPQFVHTFGFLHSASKFDG